MPAGGDDPAGASVLHGHLTMTRVSSFRIVVFSSCLLSFAILGTPWIVPAPHTHAYAHPDADADAHAGAGAGPAGGDSRPGRRPGAGAGRVRRLGRCLPRQNPQTPK